MRQESAASVKGRAHCQLAPREGTKLRTIYDAFYASKGVPIDSPFGLVDGYQRQAIEQLRSFWGLDIRFVPGSNAGRRGRGKALGKWVLVGEWFGRTYVDYIADRLAKLDREARP